MYVAILENHELAFEQYRSSLEYVSLPAQVEANYRLDAARGFFKFGHTHLAQAELSKARQLAETYAFNQLIFEIEKVADEAIHVPTQQVDESHTWSA